MIGTEIVFDLMLWTFVHGQFVGLPREHPMPLPTVEYVDESRMGERMGFPNAPPLRGAYDRQTMTIVLPLECEARMTKVCTATLVHELVHHLSFLTSRPFACKGKEEELAYTTSYKWLLDHAPSHMGEVALDPLTWMLATSCNNDMP